MKDIQIGGRKIGLEEKPYFIADIAANHDGDIQRAYHLIELAAESGADAAKFQNFKAEKIVSQQGFDFLNGQLSHQSSWKKKVFDVYKEASLSDEWSSKLKKHCAKMGIEYMTSPYDFASVDWADNFVHAYKIGSGDISWLEIIRYIANKQKPVLLATGAACMEEVKRAVEEILQVNSQLVLLQCNTNYTASGENVRYLNLNVLKTYAKEFPGIPLGLSDHTLGHVSVLGAIALGARVIEKHFTDDTSREGPDHLFSTTPGQWKEMVEAANELFLSLGDGIKRVEENERQTCLVQKRGLYLTRALSKGAVIEKSDLEPLRPRQEDGFEPWEIDSVVGHVVCRDIPVGARLLRKDVAF